MRIKIIFTFLLLAVTMGSLSAEPYPGTTLYGPNGSKFTYLRDLNNNLVNTWTSLRNGGYAQYMMPDGSMYRSAVSGSSFNGGGAQGVIQRFSWSGTLLWEYTYSSTTVRAHHDFCVMPNGNVLLIAWESKTAAQGVAAGLNHSSSLWPDHIVEVQPTGATGGVIVWEWHFWDHLVQDFDPTKSNYGVVADHPELLDINIGSTSGDWMHVNSINFNPVRNEIVFSSHNLDEVYVIDHSTTTAQAAGHTGGTRGKGGDILYRWGCASNYDATGSPQVFNVVHCGVWVPTGVPGAGNIMAFNNREGTNASMIVEIVPPMDVNGNYVKTPGVAYAPTSPTWSYSAAGFYSNHLGGCQRLPNGNTIIAESTSGNMFEVNSAGVVQWSYTPGGETVRVQRYGTNYLTAVQEGTSLVDGYKLLQNYPNPFNPTTKITYSIPKNEVVSLKVFDMLGQEVTSLVNNESQAAGTYSSVWNGTDKSGNSVSSGIYFYQLVTPNFTQTERMTLVK